MLLISFTGVRLRSAKKGIFLMSWDMKVEIEQRVGCIHPFVCLFVVVVVVVFVVVLVVVLSLRCCLTPFPLLASLLAYYHCFVFITSGVR